MNADELAAVPLPILLAKTVKDHAFLKPLALIIDLPLPFLRDLKQFLLNFTVN